MKSFYPLRLYFHRHLRINSNLSKNEVIYKATKNTGTLLDSYASTNITYTATKDGTIVATGTTSSAGQQFVNCKINNAAISPISKVGADNNYYTKTSTFVSDVKEGDVIYIEAIAYTENTTSAHVSLVLLG